MRFGEILRELRSGTAQGIKRLAPELGVSYTYLSKLENNEIRPSVELIGRVAKYFKFDRDQLLVSAGRVPDDIMEILRENPEKAIRLLRRHFGQTREPDQSP